MNDPHKPAHKPMPKPQSGGLVDPLVALSHDTATPAKPMHKPTIKPIDKVRLDEDAISLVEDDEIGGSSMSDTAARKITYNSGETVSHIEHFKRQTTKTGTGACRVRSFHGKYSDEGLKYLDNAINRWLDDHPDIEVKFVTSTVMTFEGKIREPALVLNVWY